MLEKAGERDVQPARHLRANDTNWMDEAPRRCRSVSLMSSSSALRAAASQRESSRCEPPGSHPHFRMHRSDVDYTASSAV